MSATASRVTRADAIDAAAEIVLEAQLRIATEAAIASASVVPSEDAGTRVERPNAPRVPVLRAGVAS